jgi:hypothetical protein
VDEVSRPGEPVKLVRLVNAHLSFVVARTSATCIVCHELKGRSDEPSCERWGLGAFHFSCYTDAIARSPKEQAFWAATSDEEAEPLTRFAIFLCPGCRS